MGDIIENVKEAIELFESEDQNSKNAFIKKAVSIYNYFAVDPELFSVIENTYLVGVFYSYFESFLRNTNLSLVAVENAFYFLAKTMENDMLDWNERQCAAMRIFILMHDNGYDTGRITHFEIFKRNSMKFFGTDYHTFLKKINFLGFEEQKIMRGKMENLQKDIEHGVMSYCYSIFNSEINSSFLSDAEMHRLKSYVELENIEVTSLTENINDPISVHYFNLWYSCLCEIVEHRENITIINIQDS